MGELINLPIQLVHDRSEDRQSSQEQVSQARVVGNLRLSFDVGKGLGIFRHWNQTHQKANRNRSSAQADGKLPLFQAEGICLREITSKLDNEPLRNDREQYHHQEHGALGNRTNRIKSISNLASVELIEHLTEHKGIEDDSEVVSGTILAIEQTRATVQQEDEQAQLVQRLTENIPPHGTTDQTGVTAVWTSIQELVLRWFRAQGKCTHCVHDEIDPEL